MLKTRGFPPPDYSGVGFIFLKLVLIGSVKKNIIIIDPKTAYIVCQDKICSYDKNF